ncbi:MAG: hypothetical protein ACI4QN_03440 [Candidatus Coproplasma sp.]
MLKRKRFLTAFVCVILSLITVLSFAFSGCAEYKPPEGGGDTPVVPVDPDDPEQPEKEEENDFSVQLVIKSGSVWQNFTYEYYDASDGKGGAHEQGWVYWDSIKVQWTNEETNARHIVALNNDGKAVCPGLDGDYKVTLTNVPTGFTYEPNQNYADNITKKIEIVIYKINSVSGKTTLTYVSDSSIKYTAYKIQNKTGVYRAVLEDKDDRIMYAFQPGRQGTYSLTSLVDVTENKVNPKLTVYSGMVGAGNYVTNALAEKDDGGAENTYTKNIYWQYYLAADEATGSNALIFELHSTSIDGVSGYPIAVDFLIQRDGDYTREEYITTPVPVTEDFTKTPPTPSGTFTWAASNPVTDGLLLDSSKVILNSEAGITDFKQKHNAYAANFVRREEITNQVILNTAEGIAEFKNNVNNPSATVSTGTNPENDGNYYYYQFNQSTNTYTLTQRYYSVDGYYYFYDYDEATNTYTLTDRLYAVLNKPNQIVDFTDPKMNFRFLQNRNYVEFINTYRQYCNTAGAYPVNAELAQFLQDYCLANRLFNDGYGLAETTVVTYVDKDGVTQRGHYNSDEESMWMFGCGYYKQ